MSDDGRPNSSYRSEVPQREPQVTGINWSNHQNDGQPYLRTPPTYNKKCTGENRRASSASMVKSQGAGKFLVQVFKLHRRHCMSLYHIVFKKCDSFGKLVILLFAISSNATTF